MLEKTHSGLANRVHNYQIKRANGETGFTLVELLVVVVVLLILAAVAIPIYLSQQENARRSTVQSALQSVQNNIATKALDNTVSTSMINAAISDAGYKTTASAAGKGHVVFIEASGVSATAYTLTAGFTVDGSTILYKYTVNEKGEITKVS
ncbi:prepilin-type N-terminal cleavage/methylation domain-containing protein [Pseudoclavibacter soli]|uniref:prepilin-type N-terminal cleavage/methylation domain-containing protein n=1 Tax=Pseudoclavibacter soli TaxID=452623 RepID=UPI0004285E14|nr:prepilin-type N-terminal cleavage/methylation domain-containing protein [Pseudoclavibacter soli]